MRANHVRSVEKSTPNWAFSQLHYTQLILFGCHSSPFLTLPITYWLLSLSWLSSLSIRRLRSPNLKRCRPIPSTDAA